MNKIIFCLATLFLGTSILANAQNNSIGKSDPEAKVILDKVSKKFKSYSSVQANFNLKVEDAKGKVQGNKTGIVLMKGGKYKVAITGQEIYSDGTTIWTYDKAANEVTITKIDPTANTITPQKIFTNFYDKDFLYKLNGEKKEGAKVIQEIELTPVDKSKPFHKVYVFVDKASQNIVSTRILEKNGNKYTYSINSFNTKANVTDAQFVFNKAKYPGVEEVDLR
ncbi:MAG: outer membrane lipoprotein carrier protein LolA [Chitinophagaceae bacterium]|nr:outer membrane lipoprotein carrier protein LolA [Chitinophagaceae bacterium]